MVLTLTTVALMALQVPPTPVPIQAANRLVVEHPGTSADGFRLYHWDGANWLLVAGSPSRDFVVGAYFQPLEGTVQEFHATAYNAVGESAPSPVLRVQWTETVKNCQHFVAGPRPPGFTCWPVSGGYDCLMYKLPPAGWQLGDPCPDGCGWCW